MGPTDGKKDIGMKAVGWGDVYGPCGPEEEILSFH
jgi:hypothetical protein